MVVRTKRFQYLKEPLGPFLIQYIKFQLDCLSSELRLMGPKLIGLVVFFYSTLLITDCQATNNHVL